MSRHLRIASVLLLAALAVCVAEDSVSARTYYVRKRGNDRSNGTSRRQAFKTVSRALQQRLTYGDTVYIGAGTYTNSSSIRSFSATSFGRGRGRARRGRTTLLPGRPLRIVADTTGRFTGDRGSVVIAAANRWAVTMGDNVNVQFEGITFGTSRRGGRYCGLYANGSATSLAAVNCRFQNVFYGALVYSGRLIASNCSFSGNVYGAYGSNAESCVLNSCRFSDVSSIAATLHTRNAMIKKCSFDKSEYGLYVKGVDRKSRLSMNSLSVTNCDYGFYAYNENVTLDGSTIEFTNCANDIFLNRCQSDIAGLRVEKGIRPLTLVYGTASLRELRFQKCTSYGVHAVGMDRLSVKDSRFGKTPAWAAYLQARSLSVSACLFDESENALYVRGVDSSSEASLDRLLFNRCGQGLYCSSVVIKSNRNNAISTSNCNFGVVLDVCQSDLAGLKSDGDSRPVSVYGGKARLSTIEVSNAKSLGVYTANVEQLDLMDCRVSQAGSWAVYAHGTKLSVTKCAVEGSLDGIYVQETSGDGSPVLADLSISKCAGTGLQVSSSAVNLSKKSNIRVGNCEYGIYLENCTSRLSGLTLGSSNIPLYVNGGKCELDGVTIEEAGTYGLLAYGISDFVAKDLKCSGARGWGFYGYGQNFSLTESTVSNCGHGVYVDGQGAERSMLLENVSIQDNSEYGLYVRNSSLKVVPKSTLRILRNRGTGLYLAGQSIDLDADSGIEVSDNGIGIYADRADIGMSGFKLKGNGYGLLQYYGKLVCRDSNISGGRYGIYQVHSAVCSLERTTITGASDWGVTISNSEAKTQRVTLKDSMILKCGGGLNASMLNDGQLNVSGSSIEDNRSHGIYSWRANSIVTRTSFVRNRGYGILHYDGPLALTDSTIKDSGSYGVVVYGFHDPSGAKISARRNRITGNASGIYALRVAEGKMVNNVMARNRAVGIAMSVAGRGTADVWNNSIVDSQYGVAHYGGKGIIRNNVIANGDMKATAKNAYGIYRSSGSVDVGHNLLFGQQRKYVNVMPGVGDVLKPPRFIDYAKGDFRLAAGSPAINAGTSPGSLTAVDILGLSRPMFDAFEIGAFEYPDKSGSVRVLDWGELAAPPKSMLLNGRASFKSLLN